MQFHVVSDPLNCDSLVIVTDFPFDVSPYLGRDESQHYERKSLFEGKAGNKRSRQAKAVRDQVARCVAGFANAEGGVMVLGIEDDRKITGHNLSEGPLLELLKVPQTRLDPVQDKGFLVQVGQHELIVFDVAPADIEVKVIGDGYPLRIGDSTVEVPQLEVRNRKFASMSESWVSLAASGSLNDLETGLIEQAKKGAGLGQLSTEDYLLRRKLAQRRGKHVVPRNAAELLFDPMGGSHLNPGIRIFRVVGVKIRSGAEHNVEELPSIDGNLPNITELAIDAVTKLLKRPSRLVGGVFREVSEYPEFALKEAIVNTILHRDYTVNGFCTEIYLFDDRIQITSPGGLAQGVTIEEIKELKRIHSSRNSLIVRAMADLDYALGQGEGIPRMFSEMEDAFLPAPEITADNRSFTVTLRNTMTLSSSDKEFIEQLGNHDLANEEFRALLQAHRTGRVDNAYLRSRCGLDTLSSSSILRGLCDQDYLELHSHGNQSFYTLVPRLGGNKNNKTLNKSQTESNLKSGAELEIFDLPYMLHEKIRSLGKRPKQEKLLPVIHEVCNQGRWMTLAELAKLFGYKNKSNLAKHTNRLVEENQIVRRFPEKPSHPRQAYKASGLFFKAEQTEISQQVLTSQPQAEK